MGYHSAHSLFFFFFWCQVSEFDINQPSKHTIHSKNTHNKVQISNYVYYAKRTLAT